MRIVDYLKNSELPLTADVVVYREGDLAIVKIRGSGEREFIIHSEALQYAIDNCCGVVCFVGRFRLDSGIILRDVSDIVINMFSCSLEFTDNSSNVFTFYNCKNISIVGGLFSFNISSDSEKPYTCNGFWIDNSCNNIKISNVVFLNCFRSAIVVRYGTYIIVENIFVENAGYGASLHLPVIYLNGDGTVVENININNVQISKSINELGIVGISCTYCKNVNLSNIEISELGDDGLSCHNSSQINITNVHVSKCIIGLHIYESQSININNVISLFNKYEGIYFNNSKNITITGSEASNNGIETGRDGILIGGNNGSFNIIVTSCRAYNNGNYGIEEASPSDNNIIIGNIAKNNKTGNIATVGTATIATNNITS